MFLHHRIRTARIKEKLSVERLSQKMATFGYVVTRQTIHNWETGKFHPDVNSLQYLCQALDKPISFFFDSRAKR